MHEYVGREHPVHGTPDEPNDVIRLASRHGKKYHWMAERI